MAYASALAQSTRSLSGLLSLATGIFFAVIAERDYLDWHDAGWYHLSDQRTQSSPGKKSQGFGAAMTPM